MKAIHMDFAANDPRSVSAMLRGKGDRRVMLYKLFRLVEIRRNPDVAEDALSTMWVGKSEKYAAVYRVASPVMVAIRNLVMGALLAFVLL